MKGVLYSAAILAALSTPTYAQQATAVGVGQAKSTSISAAKSTAIGVGGTAVGGGVGNTGTVNVTTNPTAAIIAGSAPANSTQTITTQGKTSVSTVPSVFAPGLAAAGLETCLGSVSVGASWLGTGLTGGGSIPDPGCAARLDSRTLWAFGLKKAAIARLCLQPDIYRSMPDVCTTYVPTPTVAVVAPVAYSAYGETPYNGGDIWLSHDGGPQRLCHDYDQPNQRCRVWAGVKPHSASKKRLKSDVIPTPKTAALTEKDLTK
jgi:hypothetical protein